mmetsp:Transcript_42026/g.99037  ORF Transcript_42026/g.99037 Transcript_42026/m.99037 type:complete len:330 (+) Transcript_42026:170-1159(+)
MGMLETLFPIMYKKHSLTLKHAGGAARTLPGPPGEYFLNAENLFIHHKQFIPQGGVKALVFFCYGAGEILERQEKVAKYLAARGFAVFLHDHQGHGYSEGERQHVAHFDNYVSDFYQRARLALDMNPGLKGLPRFAFGHSMGGLVVVRALQRATEEQFEWSGMVLSGPAMKVDPKVDNAVNRFLAKTLSSIIPKWQVPWEYGPIAKGTLTHDKECEDAYFSSKMVYHGPIRVNWALQFMTAQNNAFQDALKIQHPVICQHGDSDKIIIPGSSKEFLDKLSNVQDKTHIFIKDGWHEIMNEPEPWFSQVMETYVRWMDGHLVKPYLPKSI